MPFKDLYHTFVSQIPDNHVAIFAAGHHQSLPSNS